MKTQQRDTQGFRLGIGERLLVCFSEWCRGVIHHSCTMNLKSDLLKREYVPCQNTSTCDEWEKNNRLVTQIKTKIEKIKYPRYTVQYNIIHNASQKVNDFLVPFLGGSLQFLVISECTF